MNEKYISSTEAIQKEMIEIWKKVLDIEHINKDDKFLELGGNSLKAIELELRISMEFEVEINIENMFNNFTVRKLSEYIESSNANKNLQIKLLPVDKKEYYPMSSIQRSMYILNQNPQIGTAYNLPFVRRLHGKIDESKLDFVFKKLIKRHESFRTSFALKNGEFIQKISDSIDFKIDFFETDEAAVKLAVERYIRPFNLNIAPLFRCALFKITNLIDNYVLIIDIHHIISDNVSVGIILNEIKSICEGAPLQENKIHYKDYSVWKNNLIENGYLKQQEKYWDEVFLNGVPQINMPLDYNREHKKTFDGGEVFFSITGNKTNCLKNIALAHGTTLNIIIMSLYALLLYKYTGQNTIMIGSIMSGRELLDLENVIGNFANYLPIKFTFDDDMTFNNYIMLSKNIILQAYSNRGLPYEKIVQKYASHYESSRNPLFDTAINFHNEKILENDNVLGNIEMSHFDYTNSYKSSLDFMVHIYEENNILNFFVEYNSNLFIEQSMQLLCSKFKYLIDYFIENSHDRIADLKIFTNEEDSEIKGKLNANYNCINVAVASSFVSEPIGKHIKWWNKRFNINASIRFAPYNQVYQELINEESLISTNEGINIILFRPEDWINDKLSLEDIMISLDKNFIDFTEIIINKNKRIPYVFGIFPVSPKYEFNIYNILISFNVRFKEVMKDIKNVFIIDFNNSQEIYCMQDIHDQYKDKISHMPYIDYYYAVIGTLISRWINSFFNQQFKVIAMDCDNTLWKGICGEDGAKNVKIEGPYKFLQEFMVEKYNQGFLLVLCSKNNEDDVWNVFDKNSQMILKKDNFIYSKINWEKKSVNLKKIALKLNLSLDSFIFIDDNIYECFDMMVNSPEVLTLNLPQTSEFIPIYLRRVWAFDKIRISEEDKKRTIMYSQEIKRQEFKKSEMTINEFIKKLNINVNINYMSHNQFDRVYQLIQRTNQFSNRGNFRIEENKFRKLVSEDIVKCLVVDVTDNFGDYGLTGVIIVKIENDVLNIDTFSLSCRILGRGIEEAIFKYLKDICIEKNIKYIQIDFYSTEKNKIFYEFINKMPIISINKMDMKQTFKIDILEISDIEDLIHIVFDNMDTCNNNIRIQNDQILYEYEDNKKILNSDINLWQVNLLNENHLKHKAHYYPLKYVTPEIIKQYDGDIIVGNSIYEKIQNELIKIWEKTLNINNISAEDNFILLGGNSFDAASAISNIYKNLNVEISFYDFFNCSTIKELTQYIQNNIFCKTEYTLLEIWKEILNIEEISIENNFLELGGNSIDAARIISNIFKKLKIEISFYEFFKYPTIKDLTHYIININKISNKLIRPAGKKEYYPISLSQRSLFTLSYQFKNTTSFNNPCIYIIEGKLDTMLLKSVFENLVERHEAFRTSFEIINDIPVQKVHDSIDFNFVYDEVLEKNINNRLSSLIIPFNISKAPLLRAGILKINESKNILFFDMHHIIFDGVSLSIIFNEIKKLYSKKSLKNLAIQYKDFSVWQNEQLTSKNMIDQKSYWSNIYKDGIPNSKLPYDYIKLNDTEYLGESIGFGIPNFILERLNKISKDLSITLHNLLFSTYALLISKYTGQNELVIGSISMGRNLDELNDIIGNFTNVLPIKFNINDNISIYEYLKNTGELIYKAFDNQYFPIWELLSEINIKKERRLAINPFFDTMFLFHNQFVKNKGFEIGELKCSTYNWEKINSGYDIQMEAFQWETNNINLRINYNKNLFNHDTIERLIKNFINLLNKISENQLVLICDINLLDEVQKNQIINDFNKVNISKPFNKPIHELIEAQVEIYPNKIAIVDRERKLTYGELNNKANAIAQMIKNKGISENDVIGLLFDRNLEMIISILGIIKAGVAYLPMDTTLPKDRIKYMIEDSNAIMLLTQESEHDKIKDLIEYVMVEDFLKKIENKINHNLKLVLNPNRLFYIIYTSGTTGKPKGVMINAYPFENLVNWYCNEFENNYDDRFLIISSLGFDLTQKNLFAPLVKAGQLVLYNERIYDNNLIAKLIFDNKITIVNCAPSLFGTILYNCMENDFEYLKSLRYVFLGGEEINVSLILPWVNSHNFFAQIINTYGPTECTDISSYYALKPIDFSQNSVIPIGKPIQSVRIYILDKNMNLVPINTVGEIYIGGNNLARGYINNIEYSNKKFVTSKYPANERLYKTGDMGKWHSDGNIEFMGRRDHQVKIMGYRIELGEIEYQLKKICGLNEVVVVDKELQDNQKYICAYFVSESNVSIRELREILKDKLPEYMIPQFFLQIEKMPINNNGKIDRSVLPEPQQLYSSKKSKVIENKIEEKLNKIWRDILAIDSIGIDDDFFLFGGNSMKAIILVSRLKKEFYKDIPVKEVFNNPTIKKFAIYMQGLESKAFKSIEKVEERNYYPTSSVQKRLYFISKIDYLGISYNIPICKQIVGNLEMERLKVALIMLIERHESLRTSFEIIDDEVSQIVNKHVVFNIEEFEANSTVEADKIVSNFIRPFDLKHAPLFRVGVIKIDAKNNILITDIHHIISDGVSMDIIYKELFDIFEGVKLPVLKLQYSDFAVWQKKLVESGKINTQKDYWRKQLQGMIPLNMPLDFPRTNTQCYDGEILSFSFNSDLVEKIVDISRETNTTIHMILFAAYSTLLANYTCQEDIVIGTILSGRTHVDLENIVGMFVNTLPVRTYPKRDKTFNNLLLEIKEILLSTYENQDYQLLDILSDFNIEEVPGRMPLFDTVFSYMEIGNIVNNMGELEIYNHEYKHKISKFDFTLYVYHRDNNLFCEIEYSSKLFTQKTMNTFFEYYIKVLNEVSRDLNIKLNEIDFEIGQLQSFVIENVEFDF